MARIVSWRRQLIVAEVGVCQKCGVSKHKVKLQIHHINPRSNGGSNKRHNLLVLCHICHKKEHENDKANPC